ncbi:MAG: hypothetical protein ABEI54_01310, partial [Candidatus Bipolaricaulia bacterium]
MKLTKYKVGLLSVSILLSLAILTGSGIGVKATEWKIDKKEFTDITGKYLSNISIDLDGDANSDTIERGDTLALDFDSTKQTQSLVIDLE